MGHIRIATVGHQLLPVSWLVHFTMHTVTYIPIPWLDTLQDTTITQIRIAWLHARVLLLISLLPCFNASCSLVVISNQTASISQAGRELPILPGKTGYNKAWNTLRSVIKSATCAMAIWAYHGVEWSWWPAGEDQDIPIACVLATCWIHLGIRQDEWRPNWCHHPNDRE